MLPKWRISIAGMVTVAIAMITTIMSLIITTIIMERGNMTIAMTMAVVAITIMKMETGDRNTFSRRYHLFF